MCSPVIPVNAESGDRIIPSLFFRDSKTSKMGKYIIYPKICLWISTCQKYLDNERHPARKT